MYSHVEFTDSGNILVRSQKIRIYPKDKESAKRINKFEGLSRYWFNKAIEYLKQKDTKAMLQEVRKIQKNKHPDWAFDCPQRIREHAINDACESVKKAKLKFKKTKQFQEVKFRTKKNPKQGFAFDKQSINNNFVFKSKKHKVIFQSSEVIERGIEGCRIVHEHGRYHIIVPKKTKQLKPENQRQRIVALDPGIRTFLTMYSPNVVGKIGENDFQRIFKLCKHLDNLISRSSKTKSEKRKLNKPIQRLRWKIKDLIDDLHKKSAHFLVKNFETILLPHFQTQGMVKKLRSKTARMMLTFSHYKFKCFLKLKAEEYSCNVIDVNEAYTSKTCSNCGKLHKIGSKKTMICKCGLVMDRDVNGARNILFRALLASTK
jgi:putative transposase